MKTCISVFAAILFVIPAWAGDGHVPSHMAGAHIASGAVGWAEGEVRRVDRAQGRVTLRHGPIDSLNMPPMTMVFRVQDSAWLEGLQPGDKVRFQAARNNGAYTVTRLERASEASPSATP